MRKSASLGDGVVGWRSALWAALLAIFICTAGFSQPEKARAKSAPGPMLEQGIVSVDTPQFVLKLVRSSQTVAALLPKGAGDFDFTPGDLLAERSQNGYYHLGDLDLRLRIASDGPWKGYSTALHRSPVTPLSASGTVLAAADLAPTLPSDIPLRITRAWAIENESLVLRFTLTNKNGQPVEIGALGIPMIFNNIITGRTLEQAHAVCSFYDPYIGEDAGYLRVTRLNGSGPALLVVPDEHTPFEAYKPILNPESRHPDSGPELFRDQTPRGITFEGFYDWMVHSSAFEQNEWKRAQPWNRATAFTLQPGQSRVYALRFLLSDSIRGIEKTLTANGRPVAVGIPGYILPTDMEGHLFLTYPQPVRSITVEPVGAIVIQKQARTPGGWVDYKLTGKTWGEARVSITYQDSLLQTINYRVIKPEAEAVTDLGHFLTTKQWFSNPADPFHRSPSSISYDREVNKPVTQDSRVWIAGLSDEAGAGSWLALAMKELGEPDGQELAKFETFVDGVLWGQLQYSTGAQKYGVRKSLFYYQPDTFPSSYYRTDLNWKTWTSWNKKASEAVDRSFNYPHVASAYWVMYELARNHPGLVTNHPWQWYLDHAYETTMGMMNDAPYYTQFGQMEGDVFVYILADLKREGMTAQANDLEAAMRKRAEHWKTEMYPFASEMPWDSTGQEEVYAWMTYFGYRQKAVTTIDAILGYDPAIPSWGYNGSARRYWDFIFGGKVQRLERQLHHYGSGINAVPLLAEYRSHPSDLYLLRVGYGGTMGELSNIDEEGFASAAFHAFPDMLSFDPYSGDYGTGFWGFAVNTATYVTHDAALGWLSFGGNLQAKSGVISVVPVDAFRTRVYLASAGLWLTLDAGKFRRITLDSNTGIVRLSLEPATKFTANARLRIDEPAKSTGAEGYRIAGRYNIERGAYVVPLGRGSTEVVLQPGATAPH
ncbi:MAG TPA: DUF5695 domain-containing protein [Acidobacteriaceae bacterium]|nr:DUF5695 domain-containing protein [Acidobacteriaceae bacterium]